MSSFGATYHTHSYNTARDKRIYSNAPMRISKFGRLGINAKERSTDHCS